jgi:hypothetical protein
MGFQLVCPANGQGLGEALEATREFLHILKDLPFRPIESAQALATHGSQLVLAEAVALGAAMACWAFYLLTRNCSHVDRLWWALARSAQSLAPPVLRQCDRSSHKETLMASQS